MVTFRDGSRETLFWDFDEAIANVYMRDAVDTSLVDIHWMMGMSGGEAVFSLNDHRSMAQHSIIAGLNSVGLAHRSGNQAVALSDAWHLIDTAIVDTQLDFDMVGAASGCAGRTDNATMSVAPI